MWQSVKNIYHLVKAVLANSLYDFPGKSMTVIGVTGTDGKTTTSSIIYHILETAGKKAALITSVGATINGKISDTGFHVTTPDVFALQKYLRKAKDSGSDYVVLEVTSHGLDQNRVWGVPFTIGVLTNVTHEHLDYHKTYDRYVRAKAKLLRRAQFAVINKDDKASYERLKKILKDKHVITYSREQDADITEKTVPFKTTLPGAFNRSNILAAIAVTKKLGIDTMSIQKAVKTYRLPIGREEVVYDKGFTIMIDFAHTPNAILAILSAIREEIKTNGRIIHVFGSAAKRDVTKRPIMGKNSGKYADIVILTAEDPRNESVEKIMDQIKAGITDAKAKKEVYAIADRQEAITKAVLLARKNDYIVITGKGHEKSMNYGHGEEPWSDHEAVKIALREKAANGK